MSLWRTTANGFLARAARPPLASTQDLTAEGAAGPISVRLYRPTTDGVLPVIVFIHGGGFVFGDLETHDALCRHLAIQSGVAVVALDYRLAPEAPYPAGLEDCTAALNWLASSAAGLGLDAGRIAVAGDSAGAHLAMATALTARDHGPRLSAIGLLYPLVDPAHGSDSIARRGEGYMLTSAFIEWQWSVYRGEAADSDPLFNLPVADLKGLPPTIVVTAGFDPLADEGKAQTDRLKTAGVAVTAKDYPDMIHGFAALPMGASRADDAIAFLAGGLRQALG